MMDKAEARLRGFGSGVKPITLAVDDKATPVLSAVNAQVNSLANRTARINISVVGQQALQAAQRQIDALQRRGYANMAAGAFVTSAVTRPVVGLGAGVLKEATGYQEAMQRVVTLTDVAKSELGGLHKQVLMLSTDARIRQGPQELADALYYVTSTGLKGADGMKVLRASAYAASAGLGETKTVANTVTTVLDAYGLSADKAAKVTDTLTQAVKFGKGEAAAYAGAFPKVIAIAAQAGVSFEEVAAQMASATRLGLTPSETSTALRQIFSNLIDPSDKAKRAMKELGTSVEELRRKLRAKDLFNVLKELSERTGGRIGPITELFGSIRALTGFLSTTGEHTLKEYKRTLDSMGKPDAAFDAAGIASETLAFKWEKFRNTVARVGIEIGDRFIGQASKATDYMADTLPGAIDASVRAWEKLPPSVQKVIKTVGTLVLLAGPIKLFTGTAAVLISTLLGFGKVIPFLLTVSRIIPLIQGMAVGGALFGGAGALAAFTAGIGPVLLGLAAIAAAVAAGVVGWNKLKEFIKDSADQTRKLSDNAVHLDAAFDRALSSTRNPKVKKMLDDLQNGAKSAGDDVQKLDKTLEDAMNAKREIKKLGLAPNAEDPLLSAIDRIIKGIEQRTIHIGVTAGESKTEPLPEWPDGPIKEGEAERARGMGIRWPEAVDGGLIPLDDIANARAEVAIAIREQAEAEEHLRIKTQATNAVLKASSDLWSDHADRALGKYSNNLRELMKLQDEYNRKHKEGWQPTEADKTAIGNVNARVLELRDKVASDAALRKRMAQEKAADDKAEEERKSEETAERLRAILAKQLGDQMQMWDSYGNVVEGVLGRIHQIAEGSSVVGEKTARARMEAELMKRQYDGIPEPLRNAAKELAVIEYKMQRIVDLRDGFRGIFNDMFKGLTGREAQQFAAMVRDFEVSFGQRTQMAGLKRQARENGLPLVQSVENNRSSLSTRKEQLEEAGRKRGSSYQADVYTDSSSGGNSNALEVAKSFLGMSGGDPRAASLLGSAYGDEWCAGFVRGVLKRAGNSDISKAWSTSNRVMDVRAWAQRNGRAYTGTPKAGDVFTLSHGNGKGHTGFVSGVANGRFTTVAGNEGSPNNYKSRVKNDNSYRVNDPRMVFISTKGLNQNIIPVLSPTIAGPKKGALPSWAKKQGWSLKDYEDWLLLENGIATAAPIPLINKNAAIPAGTKTEARVNATPQVTPQKTARQMNMPEMAGYDGRFLTTPLMPKAWGGMMADYKSKIGESTQYREAAEARLQDMMADGRKFSDAQLKMVRDIASFRDLRDTARKATEGARESIQQMGREIRLMGRENNPFAILDEEFTHGAGAFLSKHAKASLYSMNLKRVSKAMQVATDEFYRENTRRAKQTRENMGMLGEGYDPSAYDRAQQKTANKNAVWDSLRGNLQEADELDKQGKKADAARMRANINRQAQTRLAALNGATDADRQEASKRGYADTMFAQKQALALLDKENQLLRENLLNREEIARVMAGQRAYNEEYRRLIDGRVDDKGNPTGTAIGEMADIKAKAEAARRNAEAEISKGAQGQAVSDASEESKATTRRMAELAKQRKLISSYDSDNPELEIQLQLLQKRNELEAFNVQALAEARVNVDERMKKYEEQVRYESEISRLQQSRANLLSAQTATWEAEKEHQLMMVYTAAERLRIEQAYQEKLRERQGIETSPEERVEQEKQVQQAAQNEKLRYLQDFVQETRSSLTSAIKTGFKDGWGEGAKSFLDSMTDNILNALSENASYAITSRIFGKGNAGAPPPPMFGGLFGDGAGPTAPFVPAVQANGGVGSAGGPAGILSSIFGGGGGSQSMSAQTINITGQTVNVNGGGASSGLSGMGATTGKQSFSSLFNFGVGLLGR